MQPQPRQPEVIWLASYPKSGNTWLRVLLANLQAFASSQPVDLNRNLGGPLLFRMRENFESITMLDSSLLTHEEIELLLPAVHRAMLAELRGRLYAKTHDAYLNNTAGESLHGESAGAVYVIRDPRDVAVSLAHHSGFSIDRAIQKMNDPTGALARRPDRLDLQLRQRLSTWSGHVESWLAQRDTPMHLIRYEDLQQDTVAAVRALVAFLGLAAPDAAIRQAVANASFTELQKYEQQHGFAERVSAAPFFRQGRAGAWRDTLTAAQARAIETAHAGVMQRFGYA